MCIKNKVISYFMYFFVLYFFYNCVNNEKKTDKGVECRLYWIGDSYPLNTSNAGKNDFRMISLHYLIINNSSEDYYLPIKRGIPYDKEKSTVLSEISVTIDKEPIDTWFSTDIRWNGILKHGDSIHANLKIPERLLDNKRIELMNLLSTLELNYKMNIADTINSDYKIPLLVFTKNDTIAIHYRDTIVVSADHGVGSSRGSRGRTCPFD